METPFDKGECCFYINHCLNPYLEGVQTQMKEKNLSVKEVVEGFEHYYTKGLGHWFPEMVSEFLGMEYGIEEDDEE
jgi:hypothetical protein